jgi:hypothetical protein
MIIAESIIAVLVNTRPMIYVRELYNYLPFAFIRLVYYFGNIHTLRWYNCYDILDLSLLFQQFVRKLLSNIEIMSSRASVLFFVSNDFVSAVLIILDNRAYVWALRF